MKKIILIIFLTLSINAFCQDNCVECDEAVKTTVDNYSKETTTAILYNSINIFSNDILENFKNFCINGTTLNVELGAMSEKEFRRLCGLQINFDKLKELAPTLEFYTMRNGNKIFTQPILRPERIELIERYKAEITNAKRDAMWKNIQTKMKIQHKLEAIAKLNREIELEKQIIKNLEKDIDANNLEIIDAGIGLVLKVIPFSDDLTKLINDPIVQSLIGSTEEYTKEQLMRYLREKKGVEKIHYDNIFTDWIDPIVNAVETTETVTALTGKIPKQGVVMTNTLWNIFKITPNLVTEIGITAANFDIYMMKGPHIEAKKQKIREIKLLQDEIIKLESK
jgi:hypothetical protein